MSERRERTPGTLTGPRAFTVLHHVQRWLPLSEHFVHGLVTGSRHGAVVVAAEGTEHREEFRGVRVVALPRLGRRATTVALAAVAAAHRARVVHAHFGYRAPDVIGVCQRRHLPLVVSLHGHDATAFVRAWPRHYDALVERADAWIVPSRYLADVATTLGIPRERVHVIPVGVDTAWFAASAVPEGPPTVAFVGRLVEKKGIDTLVRAWPAVRAAVPSARLVVLGDGPLAPLLAGPGVEHLRPEARDRARQVREVLRAATVVATPSRTALDGDVESLLLVNLEAQASGRAVVTTRHGGIPEFVDEGRSGLLVDEGDPDALAAALIAVLRDPALAGRLGAAGPSVAARFDVRACTARVDDLYDELVAR